MDVDVIMVDPKLEPELDPELTLDDPSDPLELGLLEPKPKPALDDNAVGEAGAIIVNPVVRLID